MNLRSLRTVQLTQARGMAFLILDRPPKNVMDGQFFEELSWVVREGLPEMNARAVVVHGRGKHFSSGADLEELRAKTAPDATEAQHNFFYQSVASFQTLGKLGVPVVAAVSGCCLGSGMELALACDYRITTRNTVFALPETQFNLMPGCGGTIRLPGLVGRSKAMELILTGRTVLAEDAHALGIVDAVVEKKDLLDCAEEWAVRGRGPRTRDGVIS